MFNYSCSLNTVFAWVFWALACVCSLLYAFVAQAFGGLIVLLVAAGATLHVRGFIHAQCRQMQAAFNLGRESVRAVR